MIAILHNPKEGEVIKIMTPLMISNQKSQKMISNRDFRLLNSNLTQHCMPSQLTWPVSWLVGCYHLHALLPFINITQPESWYSFYRPTDGGRLSRPVCTGRGCLSIDKHNCPRWDSNPGPLISPSGTLRLDYCDMRPKETEKHGAILNCLTWRSVRMTNPACCVLRCWSVVASTRRHHHRPSLSQQRCHGHRVLSRPH